MRCATFLLWILLLAKIAVIQNLQIDFNEFSKTKIVLTMSATRVDAIVRAIGLSVMPPAICQYFQGFVIAIRLTAQIAKSLLSAVFPSDAPVNCAIRKPACISASTIAVIPECGN